MLEDDGVLPHKADYVWSGGLDDARQSTARPAATARPATEPGADADTCLERDQARPEPARAQLPEPGRRHQDATRGRGPDLGNNPGHAATAATTAAAVVQAQHRTAHGRAQRSGAANPTVLALARPEVSQGVAV